MTVKIDEDLSGLLKPLLNAAGYVALTVNDQGWTGAPDHVLFPLVQMESECLITADAGFADIRAYPPGTHCGILLLQSVDQTIRSWKSLLWNVLQRHNLADHVGHVMIASESGIVIRIA